MPIAVAEHLAVERVDNAIINAFSPLAMLEMPHPAPPSFPDPVPVAPMPGG